jgi:hypothetical protein
MKLEDIGQLKLALDVDAEADDALERNVSREEAALISQSAQDALEAGSTQGAVWLNDYAELRAGGWPWRVAVYIAWVSSPRTDRWPNSQRALAVDVLGLKSDRTIRKWREKNPAIDAAAALLQAKTLFEHRREIFDALIASASQPCHKNHPDRKLALEMLGDYTPTQKIEDLRKPNDLSTLSDADLARAERKLEREYADG